MVTMDLVPVLPSKRCARALCVCLLIVLVLAGCSWREEKATLYPNGQIRIRWHERMIGPYRTIKDGTYEAFYPTGARLASGEFKNGDSVGLWEEWYLYGGKRYEKTYGPHAKQIGRSVVWMPSGDTLAVHTYNELGEPDGRLVAYWPDTGELQEEGEFKNGRRHGVWQAWYRNGRPKYEREYHEGRRVGTWTDFGPDGNIASRREYQRELPPELERMWGTALVDGVPVGTSEDFQRRQRTVDTIPAEERVYGDLRLRGQEWIVPFKWISPRFEAFYKPRYDTLVVWRPSPPPLPH
jgi:antitoxin component YwqK of YwqJK toxin-antitoxin module